jgi:catechol 2,3-dioxygenase-like lactoylglutathione lyase family enzyme
MKIDSLDHLVLTVKDIGATCEFYAKVLEMEIVTFGENRKALSFGSQKINLQQLGRESTLRAEKPTPGSADVCFVTSVPLSDVIAHLNSCGVKLIGGPVERNGARGLMMSVYFRDPDLNLIEVSNYTSGNLASTRYNGVR